VNTPPTTMSVQRGWRKTLHDCLKRMPDELTNSTLASLATVRTRAPGGGDLCDTPCPAVRTVNLRGLTAEQVGSPNIPDDKLMSFVTDARSDKVNEMRANPRGELLLWFPESRVQIRVAGTLKLTQGDAAAFAKLAEYERLWFTWPTPGQPRDVALDGTLFPKTPPAADAMPDSFAVTTMDPDFVETFDGSTNPYTAPFVRMWYTRDERDKSWTAKLVNP
jgi:pyridoxamine 5'-phosphate oxidase